MVDWSVIYIVNVIVNEKKNIYKIIFNKCDHKNY